MRKTATTHKDLDDRDLGLKADGQLGDSLLNQLLVLEKLPRLHDADNACLGLNHDTNRLKQT